MDAVIFENHLINVEAITHVTLNGLREDPQGCTVYFVGGGRLEVLGGRKLYDELVKYIDGKGPNVAILA